MKLVPLDDRIVVAVNASEDKTPGGIVLPENAKEKSQQGEVLAVGPGVRLDNGMRAEIAVFIGDVVLFSKYGGSDIEIDGKEYKILRESDVLAKVK